MYHTRINIEYARGIQSAHQEEYDLKLEMIMI